MTNNYMVSIESYKKMYDFLENYSKDNFTISDVRRNTTLSPQVISKILQQMTEKKYLYVEGEKIKRYTKIKNIDFDFLMSVS